MSRNISIFIAALLWLTAGDAFAQRTAQAAPGALLRAEVTGGRLVITASLPGGVSEVELRLESERPLSRISDVSPLAPESERPPRSSEREIWYPVVDLWPEPPGEIEGVMVFDGKPRVVAVNHHFYGETLPPAAQVVIPGSRLEFWENTVFVAPAAPELKSFYLRERVGARGGRLRRVFRLLAAGWAGTVSLHAAGAGGGREIGRVEVRRRTDGAGRVATQGAVNLSTRLDRARLLESLKETIAYTLRSQNTDPDSPTRGGLHLFYDLDARTFRSSYWVWGWGPSVKLLLEASRLREVAGAFGAARLRRVADEIGRASLRFQVREPGHPLRGVATVRWDRSLNFDFGHRKSLSPSDSNFLAGWAWVPLAEERGVADRAAYLDAAKQLALATDRLMNEHELVPQDYYDDLGRWAGHTLEESGFGVEGLAELYRVTGDDRFRQIGERYIRAHVAKLEQPDGLWGRRWDQEAKRLRATTYHTRGQGWAMEGLLAAHRLQPGGPYLEKARRLADHLVKWQRPDGSWAFPFNRRDGRGDIDEKGVALWSLLLYRLYDATGEAQYLDAARRALGWCLKEQYRGEDAEARGSLPGASEASAVGYRHWFRVSCTYTSAFFGLAVLEELRLQSRRPTHPSLRQPL